MIKLGVLYIPEEDLINDVNSLKKFFKEKTDKSMYLNHLVHSTIYVLNIEPNRLNYLIEEFESLKKVLSPLNAEITNWRVFENDILTNLNTLCLEIEKNKDLKVLQEKVVKSLFKFHSKKMNNNFKGGFKDSNDKYGYPFIGNHWTPHFTIGSLEIHVNKISKYSEGLFNFPKEFKINNLCLFEIKEDSHLLIKKIEF
jgi:2'-5' RNA ligase